MQLCHLDQSTERSLTLPTQQVILCSACSGHGFKMSSGIGQILAQMATEAGPVDRMGSLERELRLHRLHPGRQGHTAFLKALGAL